MDCSKILDIIAYYLSEFDMRAFGELGFATQAQGFSSISAAFGRKSSYLRRLRDEYDVVTSSARKGQRNRAPRVRVVEIGRYLESFSFVELTEIVKAFLENAESDRYVDLADNTATFERSISDAELEAILNFQDTGAAIRIRTADNKVRVCNTSIIKQLKKLYGGRCQLCGERPFQGSNVDICEAHHIDYFSLSQNNNTSNLIIVCPNHHRLIHKLNPVFDAGVGCFRFPDGEVIRIVLDMHLKN